MKRSICIFISILLIFSMPIPVFSSDDNIVSYTLSGKEMLAMLNAGRCGYAGTMPGSDYVFHGTLTFSPFDTGSDGVYAIANNTQGGPNAQVSFTFEFPLNIKCLTCTISSAFGTKLINDNDTFSYLVPTDGWFGAYEPFPSDIQQSNFQGKVNTNTITNFDVLITNATFIYDDMTNFNGFQNYFQTGWGYVYNNQFLYCINAITYTGRKADIDDLVNAIDSLIQNNNDNTDKIIANQDKNTEEIKDKIWDSTYQAGTHIMENQDKNTEKILDDINTAKPEDVEKLEDYKSSVDSVQSEADEISSALDSVQDPDLDSIDFDLSSDVNIGTVNQFFTTLYSCKFVVKLLFMVVIVSLCSFILYGKKT